MVSLFDVVVAWVVAHPTTSTVVSLWLFSNIVSAMPTPDPASGKFYHWLFDFSHTLAGNAARVLATRFPNSFLNGASSAEQPKAEAPVPPSQ